jgi:hypothetical protein
MNNSFIFSNCCFDTASIEFYATRISKLSSMRGAIENMRCYKRPVIISDLMLRHNFVKELFVIYLKTKN